MRGLGGNVLRVVACRCAAALGLAVWLGAALAQASPDAAQALRAQRDTFSEQLQHNVFARPLVLLSSETPPSLGGDIYALMAFPFASVSRARGAQLHRSGHAGPRQGGIHADRRAREWTTPAWMDGVRAMVERNTMHPALNLRLEVAERVHKRVAHFVHFGHPVCLSRLGADLYVGELGLGQPGLGMQLGHF